MTTVFTIILETISDLFLLLTIICVTNILHGHSEKLFLNYRKRISIALLVSSLISIIFIQNFFEQLIYLKWLLIFINFFKYVFLSTFIYRKFSIKILISSLIIHFICSNVTSGLLALIPMKEIKEVYLFNIALTFFVRLIILLIILYINKKNDHDTIQIIILIIPQYIYVLILLSLFLSNGLTQTANFTTSNISVKFYMIKIFAFLLTICLAAIILSLLFNVISKKYHSDINEILKKQVDSQLAHYELLNKVNTDIRSFKHDYTNHMKCMRSMVSNKEYDDLLTYLNNLVSLFPSTSFIYDTGNYVADAILTEKQVNTYADIFIKFNGIIPTDIDNTDLCIILSNALDNAIEACCLCNCDKIINVYSGFKHGYFVLKIKNPTINIIADNKLTTTKVDTVNHGFGLANIKRTVKKYNGYVATECENNIFSLNITFMSISNDV